MTVQSQDPSKLINNKLVFPYACSYRYFSTGFFSYDNDKYNIKLRYISFVFKIKYGYDFIRHINEFNQDYNKLNEVHHALLDGYINLMKNLTGQSLENRSWLDGDDWLKTVNGCIGRIKCINKYIDDNGFLDYIELNEKEKIIKEQRLKKLKNDNIEKFKVNKNGHIYLIESEHGYKIGRSKHIKTRVNLFNIKLPFEITLIRSVLVYDYVKAEKYIHKLFKDKRMNGEWFDMSKYDIELFDKEIEQFKLYDHA